MKLIPSQPSALCCGSLMIRSGLICSVLLPVKRMSLTAVAAAAAAVLCVCKLSLPPSRSVSPARSFLLHNFWNDAIAFGAPFGNVTKCRNHPSLLTTCTQIIMN